MSMDKAFFIRTLLSVVILLSCGQNLHNRIISVRGEVLAHKTSLTPPLFYKNAVPSQESELSCIFVLHVFVVLRLD